MISHTVFLVIILAVNAYADDVHNRLWSNNKATESSYEVVGIINNKGRRYLSGDGKNATKEVDEEEKNIDLINKIMTTRENNNLDLLPIFRSKRSFDHYDDVFDNYRHTNRKQKNNNPKNLLDEVRSGSSPSSTYNEDQERRMFFSQIFSLFDDDTNIRKSGRDHDKQQLDDFSNRRSMSFNDRGIDRYKDSKPHEQKTSSAHNNHNLYTKSTSTNKKVDTYNDSFESIIESLMNDINKSKRSHSDDNVDKHRKKMKSRRQVKGNNARPERQLGDLDIDGAVNEFQEVREEKELISNSRKENGNKKASSSEEVYINQNFDDNPLQSASVNIIQSSTEPYLNNVLSTVLENDNSRRFYSLQSQSSNYIQPDTIHSPSSTSHSLKENDNVSPQYSFNSTVNDGMQTKDTPVFSEQDHLDRTKLSSKKENDDESNSKESLTLTYNIDDNVTIKKIVETVSQKDDLEIKNVNYENESEAYHDMNVENVTEDNMRHVISIIEKIPNNIENIDERRSQLTISKVNNLPEDISDLKDVVASREQEPNVYDETETVLTDNNAVNPLSARIKLDLFIEIPSQIIN